MNKKVIGMVCAAGVISSIFTRAVYAENVKVTFENNNGIKADVIEVEKGVPMHELPLLESDDEYFFAGWYADEALSKRFNILNPINEDTTIYAKWKQCVLPFTDVKDDDRFIDAIEFVYYDDIMNGISNDEFAPDSHLTRGMLVTILHRFAGEPVVNYAMSFKDVEAGAYYAEAVRWAQSEGVVNGYSEDEFAPNVNITREQLASVIYRYAELSGLDLDELSKDTNTLSFDDIFDVSEYAKPAMHCCLATGIIEEREEGIVAPQSDATRSEAANAVYKYYSAVMDIAMPDSINDASYSLQDKISQRANMLITNITDSTADFMICWSNDSNESTIWEMTAISDTDGKYTYDNCKKQIVTYDEEGNEDSEVVYENGKGYFTVDFDKMTVLWDGADEEECKNCVFVEFEEEEIISIPNPIEETDKEGLTQTLGLDFAVPDGAENVKYYIINNRIAQMRFTLDNVEYNARISSDTEFTDISGMYYEWTSVTDSKVKDKAAKVMKYDTDKDAAIVCLWQDTAPGLMYSISVVNDDIKDIDIEAVAEQCYIPVQMNN